MPGITTRSAPGIAFAVASPPATFTSGSSAPWMTTVGTATRGEGSSAVAARRRRPCAWRMRPSA